MNRHTATTLVLVAAVGLGSGCGHDDGMKGANANRDRRLAGVKRAPAPEPEMELQNELGIVETVDVEETLEGHLEEIRACYQRAGKAQRYAAGKVTLRFLVDGSGQPQDVLVVESNLGNYSVERCLVDVGRRVSFKAPAGHKATTFDYPVEFRSTEEMTVIDLDGAKIEHDILGLRSRIAACGRLAADDVTAIMYIEPNGFPGSVGLSAPTTFDQRVAGCVIHTIGRSRMATVLPGRVLRCTFSIRPVMASADPPLLRRGASSGGAHRRRR